MKFELLPILDLLIEFYQQERSPQRFQEYLRLMMNEEGDLDFPLPLINPMAKEHLPLQLQELRNLDAENHVISEIENINEQTKNEPYADFRVCLILADDWKGGWTNRFSTDYSNTFHPKGIFRRQFCTPLLWTSEPKSTTLIKQRTAETLWRTIYQLQHSWPTTLADHLKQEAFVRLKLDIHHDAHEDLDLVQEVYDEFKMSEKPSIIIPFLYGDQAAESLGHPPMGAFDYMGFRLATQLKL
jgi:hypothetical protein